MSEVELKRIELKLDQITRLIAINAVKDMKLNNAILALGAAGLERSLIAEILGTTPNTVSTRLSEAKAKVRKNAKRT
jgi:DNA-directed RNA polymerase specialized sigma24 family protein